MIVDDVPVNTKLLTAHLPLDEYEVIKAHDGKEALEKMQEEIPDLILLDIMMPGMDGYEVTRRLKNNPETRDIPIILVTAMDDRENKRKALEAGADDFLNKPVNKTGLLTRIRSLLCLKEHQEQQAIRAQSEQLFVEPVSEGNSMEESRDFPLILIVENNDKDAKLIEAYLYGQAYQTKLAGDGEGAISCVQQEKVDLILLDILLPGMNSELGSKPY